MDIEFFIIYLVVFFWILPAFKQYKTELFWYFLVFAVKDPIILILIPFHLHIMFYIYGFFNLLLLFSVLWSSRDKRSTRIFFAVALISVLITFFTSQTTLYPKFFIHMIITYFFILRTFSFVAKTGKANIFHLFLLMEEVSIIFKNLAVIIDIKTGTGYFYATSAFQILIAIFFTLYREDNKKLHIDLRNN